MASPLSEANTERWLSDAEEVFSEKEYSHTHTNTPTISGVFKDLNNQYKSKIKSWWETKGLESYIKHHIVPKGLRITILPALRSRSTDLMKKWEEEATASSLRLMKLLLAEEKLTLEKTSAQLKSTIEEALKLKSEADFQKKETELQSNIEKYTALLKERKHLQFVRDLTEFRENRAYTFLYTNPRPKPNQSDISSSDADYSDSDRKTNKKTSGFRRSPYSTRQRNRGGWNNGRPKDNQGSGNQPKNPENQTGNTATSQAASSSSSTGAFLEKTLHSTT